MPFYVRDKTDIYSLFEGLDNVGGGMYRAPEFNLGLEAVGEWDRIIVGGLCQDGIWCPSLLNCQYRRPCKFLHLPDSIPRLHLWNHGPPFEGGVSDVPVKIGGVEKSQLMAVSSTRPPGL